MLPNVRDFLDSHALPYIEKRISNSIDRASYYLLTYLLTPCCRVLLEKLTGLQLVKKLSAFHGIRRFITALTSVRHLSLSWANTIQSTYHIHTSHLYAPSPPHTCHMPCPSHSSRFYHPHNIGCGVHIT